MALYFHTEDTSFELPNRDFYNSAFTDILHDKRVQLGELNIIFCSNNYILEINRKYLNHDYHTDVITFDYTEGKTISGDIFVSIDQVAENANMYHTEFYKELERVMIHGILHLMGWDDKSIRDQKNMRIKEDEMLVELNRRLNEKGI